MVQLHLASWQVNAESMQDKAEDDLVTHVVGPFRGFLCEQAPHMIQPMTECSDST